MRSAIMSIALGLLWAGCAYHSAPQEGVRYAETVGLGDLAGLYKNQGSPQGHLSKILFTPAEMASNGVSHDDISWIDVTTSGDVVEVEAITQACGKFSKTYQRGRDFELEEGKIVLRQETSVLNRGADDPLVGPSYEKAVITLDHAGHGIYRSEEMAAGLAFLLIPVAMSSTTEIRFERQDRETFAGTCGIPEKSGGTRP